MGIVGRLILRLAGDERGDLEMDKQWRETPKEWRSAAYVKSPSIDECWLILNDATHLSPRNEKIVRQHLWWVGNDHLRSDREGKPLSDKPLLDERQVESNMEALYILCNQGKDRDRIVIGELLRELGRFEESIDMIESIEDDKNRDRNRASLIGKFARQKDPLVREVWRSEYDF